MKLLFLFHLLSILFSTSQDKGGDALEGECSVTLPPTPKPRGINHQRVSSSSSVSSCISSSSTSYNLPPGGGCASPAFNCTSSSPSSFSSTTTTSSSSSASPSTASPASTASQVGHLSSQQLSPLTPASNCFLNCHKVTTSPVNGSIRTFSGSVTSPGVSIHSSGNSIKLNQRQSATNNNSTSNVRGILSSGSVSSSVFRISSVKCWEGAKSQSFYARDNVSNFIKWCRYLGVREAVIFETEDLVLHNNQRNVVLCLLEVARIICTKFGFTIVPGLVALEKEIDQEIEREELQTRLSHSGGVVTTATETSASTATETTSTAVGECGDHLHRHSIGVGEDADAVDAGINCDLLSQIKMTDSSTSTNEHQHSDHATGGDLEMMRMMVKSKDGQSDDHLLEGERQQPGQHLMAATVKSPSPSASLISLTSNNNSICSPIPPESITNQSVDSYDVNVPTVMASQLDQKVMLIAKSFYGKKAKQGIQRLEEGKYRIAGKIVFVRVSTVNIFPSSLLPRFLLFSLHHSHILHVTGDQLSVVTAFFI